jgi:endonuclease III
VQVRLCPARLRIANYRQRLTWEKGMSTEQRIKERLVEHGTTLFNAARKQLTFAGHEEADCLVSDLARYPHAFVLASIMDQQVKAERAWMIPYRFQQKLGTFSMEALLSLSEADIRRHMSEPLILHRFVEKMARYFFKAVHRIADHYQSNAALIWNDRPSSATVVFRFLEFDGVGPKIASMAANILAREFKVPFSDYFSIDISADVHVRRVFGRLGLTPEDATVEQLIFRTRGLYPEFPGLMDFPTWEIGRNWCRQSRPHCESCYMSDLCAYPQNAEADKVKSA